MPSPAAPASLPTTLPNLWQVFNLRESPYFQETLGSGHHPFPLSLFVGRMTEARHLLTAIGSARSSRQAIGGPAGVGKTTLVQNVKAEAIAAGYWAADELVPFFESDTTELVLGRLLSALYDTILAARPMATEHPAMQAAQQLVKVARLTTGGGGISILGVGANLTRGTIPVTPNSAMLFDGPRIFRDLLELVREQAGGVVLHLNNLENLTEAAVGQAADILRSLRDPILLLDGLHVLLAGTTAAVFAATSTHPQVRSVFSTPLALQSLPGDDLQALLAARYEYLALPGRPPIPPIAPAAVDTLYPLFRGDLRSLLSALEDGARLLAGVSAPGTSISLDELRPALRQRYTALLREQLDGRRQVQLDAWAERGAESEQTQRALRTLWSLSQGGVSAALADLERKGYVLALPREGKEPIQYVLTGVSRLIFG
jgi:hypothetical protein